MTSRLYRKLALFVAAVLALLVAPQAEAVEAYLMNKAGQIDGNNAPLVPLDDAMMWLAHNSFNPNEWRTLSEVLDFGVRVLELDFYADEHWHIDWTEDFRIRQVQPGSPPVVTYTDVSENGVYDDILSRVIQGIPIERSRYEVEGFWSGWHQLDIETKFTVKHDPTAEDTLSGIVGALDFSLGVPLPLGWIGAGNWIVHDSLQYGNNCHHPAPDMLSGLGGSLARCLAEIKAWSDAHIPPPPSPGQETFPEPAHLPIIVRLNIKREFDHGYWATFLDTVVRGSLGNRLITPDQVKDLGVAPGTYASLRQRVEAIGWPALEQLRGKVLVLTYLGPAFNSNPNDDHGRYVRHILRRGFEPALFLCPEANDMNDLKLGAKEVGRVNDNDPLRRAAAGYTACYTLAVHHDPDWKRSTHSRHPDAVVDLLDEAERRNFLTEVWSYAEIGYDTAFDGLMHKFLRHGVTFLERDKAFLELSYFPLVGLDSINDYAFSIRPLDNPAVAVTAWGVDPDDDGSHDFHQLKMSAYSNALDTQHWRMENFTVVPSGDQPYHQGKLELVRAHGGVWTGTKQCLSAGPSGGNLSASGPTAGAGAHTTPFCFDQSATPLPSFFPHKTATSLERLGNDIGRIRVLHGPIRGDNKAKANKSANGGTPLFLTAFGYAKESVWDPATVFQPLTDAAFAAVAGGTVKGPNGQWGIECGDSVGIACPPGATVRKQAFGLFLDPQHLRTLGQAVNRPTLSWFGGQPVSYTPVNALRSWREFPLNPFNEQTVLGFVNNGMMAREEYGIWKLATIVASGLQAGNDCCFYPPVASSFTPTQILNRQIPWTALIPMPSAKPVVAGANFGMLTWAGVASEWMDADNFEKWKSRSAVMEHTYNGTIFTADIPTGPGMQLHAQTFLDASELALWNQRQAADLAADAWLKPPGWNPANGPITDLTPWLTYGWFANDSRIRILAEQTLSPAEFEHWTLRQSLALDDIWPSSAPVIRETGREFLSDRDIVWSYNGQTVTELGMWEIRMQECQLIWSSPNPQMIPPYCKWPEHYPQWHHFPYVARMAMVVDRVFQNDDKARRYWLWAYQSGKSHFSWRDIPFESSELIADPVELATALLTGKSLTAWEIAYALQNTPQAGVTDIPPDMFYAELAEKKLSAVDFERWMQRVSTVPAHIAINPALTSVAQQFLSAEEYGEWHATLANTSPLDYGRMPSEWTDLPPATGNRELALALFTDPQVLADWDHVKALPVDMFPYHFVTEQSAKLAEQSLSSKVAFGADPASAPSEIRKWQEVVAAHGKQVAALRWTMLASHADLRPVARILLTEPEFAIWQQHIGHVHPHYLGRSKKVATGSQIDPSRFAAAMLAGTTVSGGEDFAAWHTAASSTWPIDWTAYTLRSDARQEQVVAGIFGAGSPDHAQWQIWTADPQGLSWMDVHNHPHQVAQTLLSSGHLQLWSAYQQYRSAKLASQIPLELWLNPVARFVLSPAEYQRWWSMNFPYNPGPPEEEM